MASTCDKDESVAHGEKNVRCGHTRANTKMAAKPKVKRCL